MITKILQLLDAAIGIKRPRSRSTSSFANQLEFRFPSIGNDRHLWPVAGKKELQIKKGP